MNLPSKCFRLLPLLILVLSSTIGLGQNTPLLRSYSKIADGIGGLPNNVLLNEGKFGDCVANVGDVDGDGVKDVAVGADAAGTGKVFILFLNANHSLKGYREISIGGSSRFGLGLAGLGDLDGDGVPDLAIGAIGNNSYNGVVYICFLNSNGSIKSTSTIQSNTPNFTSLTGGQWFGHRIGNIGDLDGDGVVDIIVGAPNFGGGGSGRGAVYTIFLQTNGGVKGFARIASGQGGMSNNWLQNDDNFGMGVSEIGDIDQDGKVDIAVGAFKANSGATDAGAVYIIRLNANGTAKRITLIDHTQPLVAPLFLVNSNVGVGISHLADYNIAGKTSIAVGCYLDQSAGIGRGAFYILNLDSNGKVSNYLVMNSKLKGFESELSNDDRFGTSVINIGSDPITSSQTVMVGTPFQDIGGTNRGSAYIMTFDKYDLDLVSLDAPDTVCQGTTLTLSAKVRNNSPSSVNSVITTSSTSLGIGNTTSRIDTFKQAFPQGAVRDYPLYNVVADKAGLNYFVVKLSNPGDVYAPNDSLIKFIYVKSVPPGNYSLGPDTTVCGVDSIAISVPLSGYQYRWNDGVTEQTRYVKKSGLYWVEAYNSSTCPGRDSINVTFLDDLVVDLRNDTTLCTGDSLVITGPLVADAAYLWSNGNTTRSITVTETGKYKLRISYAACYAEDSVQVDFYSITPINLGVDTFLCPSDSMTLDAGNIGAKYEWSTGDTSRTIVANQLDSLVWVRAYNAGCTTSDTIRITALPDVSVQLPLDTMICFGDSVVLDMGNPTANHFWNYQQGSQTLVVKEPGIYVAIASVGNCISIDTMIILLMPEAYCKPNRLLMPNAFSPNGDGLNDVFRPRNENIKAWEFKVVDRWGAIVFTSTDPQKGWDGTLNGWEMPDDTYVWMATYELDALTVIQQPESAHGIVHLLRPKK